MTIHEGLKKLLVYDPGYKLIEQGNFERSCPVYFATKPGFQASPFPLNFEDAFNFRTWPPDATITYS